MADDTKYLEVNLDDTAEAVIESPSRRKRPILLAIMGLTLIAIVVSCILAAPVSLSSNINVYMKASTKAKIFKNAAVAADSVICSKVGADILKKNGNAVDTAIAVLFCTGVVNLHSSGIGGGGFMVVYIKAERKHLVYDYREVAPISASENMYVNSTKKSTSGGSSIAVPGEVKGLLEIHEKHGSLKWGDLIQPSIDIAEKGFKITKTIDKALRKLRSGKYEKIDTGLRELFADGKGGILKIGDTLRNPKLAETLRNIQKHNASDFYEGKLAKQIVKDIQDVNGGITLEDLKNYKVKVRHAVQLNLPNNLTLHTMGAPSGGPIVAMILNIMSGYDFSRLNLSQDKDMIEFYQKLVESMKFSYAQRGYLGDPSYLPKHDVSMVMKRATDLNFGASIRQKISLTKTHEPSYYGGSWAREDHGTTHLSVISQNGDAVSASETINWWFGSMIRSPITGIIYNNEMDDFSTPGKANGFGYPPSPANFIRPGKRPLSSMSPVIVTDSNGDVRMVCGASGGSRIISGTAQVMIKQLLLKFQLGEAVDSFRIHHQGIPNKLYHYSPHPPAYLLTALQSIGHVIERTKASSVIQAIYSYGGYIHAKSDSRKGGVATGF